MCAIAPARAARRRTTVRAPDGGATRGRHGLERSNGDSCGNEAASADGANAVPIECGREITGRVAQEQQLRGPMRALSTFMLGASATRPLARLRTIRARSLRHRGTDRGATKSFKYVGEIAVSNTNVWPHPIALRAAGVYLRCRDARPDARIDHLQAPPPLWLPRVAPAQAGSDEMCGSDEFNAPSRAREFLRLLGALCLYRFSNEPHPTASHLR